ncbi:MAG: hypothetical protein AAGG38_07250 [Planctomycetota bacterium]
MANIASLNATVTAGVGKFQTDMNRAAKSVDRLGKTQAAAGRTMANAQKGAALRAGKLTKRLEHQAATSNLTARQAKIEALARDGASEATVKHLRALDRQLAKQEAQADAMRRGARITEDHTSALDRHRRRQRELADLVQRGAISQRTYRRAVASSAATLTASERAAARFGNRLGWIVGQAHRAGRSVRGMAATVGRSIRRLSTGVGGLLALVGGGGIGYMIGRQFAEVDSIAKTSAEIGFTTEELSGFAHGAGLTGTSIETLNKGLQRFTRRVGEAKLGVGEGLKGIERLGLDAEQLAGMDPGQAFRKVAQGIKELPGPAERAAVAYSLFGRQGQELMNFLTAGEDGINSFVEEADRLGLTFSAEDAARVEMANDGIHRLQGLVTGAARALAIRMAPILTAIAGKFTEAGTSGEGMGAKVLKAGTWVVRVAAKIADGINAIVIGFKAARAYTASGLAWFYRNIAKVRGYFSDAIDSILRKAASVAQAIPGIGDDIAAALNKAADANNYAQDFAETFAAELEATADQLGQELNDAMVAPSYGDQLTEWIDDVQRRADEAAAEIAAGADAAHDAAAGAEDFAEAMEQAERNAATVRERIAELQESVNTFGMDETQRLTYDLEQIGASPEQIDQAVKLQTQLEGLEAGERAADDMARAAEQVFNATRTPLEKYETRIDELSNLLNAGAIGWDTYGRAVQDAREQLESASRAADAAKPDAIISNSAQAMAAAYDRTIQAAITAPDIAVAQAPAPPPPAAGPTEGMKELGRERERESVAEARKGNKHLREIERNTREMVNTGVGEGITLNVVEL